jgi:hypothetical protein
MGLVSARITKSIEKTGGMEVGESTPPLVACNPGGQLTDSDPAEPGGTVEVEVTIEVFPRYRLSAFFLVRKAAAELNIGVRMAAPRRMPATMAGSDRRTPFMVSTPRRP